MDTSTSYRENYVASLRNEIVDTVARQLSPIASHYGFCDVPLETDISWRPMVLIIGNYSSGKSSLINEFLGAEIQKAGQAPTDDSFTVITHDPDTSDEEEIRVTDEQDGKSLINDPDYPFSTLRTQGQRFAAHFRLKKVNSPFLRDLAIVDTPGMLDSITERDRGYDYHEIIGDLAQKADLILVLFDAHKAGTVREAYKSIRETLNTRTFEDRVLFVLNRIDECASLEDLLRVYGALCWNLSQITGRKDIPPIHLTYSPTASQQSGTHPEHLPLLENQREQLRQAILNAPKRRLYHLATFVEVQGERLVHYLEALVAYRESAREIRSRYTVVGLILSALGAGAGIMAVLLAGIVAPSVLSAVGIGVGSFVLLIWMLAFQRRLERRNHLQRLESLDELTDLDNQTRRDSWEAVRERVRHHLEKGKQRYSLHELKRDLTLARRIVSETSRDIREAMNELKLLTEDGKLADIPDRLLPDREAERRAEEMAELELVKAYMT